MVGPSYCGEAVEHHWLVNALATGAGDPDCWALVPAGRLAAMPRVDGDERWSVGSKQTVRSRDNDANPRLYVAVLGGAPHHTGCRCGRALRQRSAATLPPSRFVRYVYGPRGTAI